MLGYVNPIEKMLGNIKRPSVIPCFMSVLLSTGCGAFEDNVTFVCQGTTETVYLKDGEVLSRELSNTRRFIAIKDRKIGNNECMFWSKGRIVCQPSPKSMQHVEDELAYQLHIDRESGEVSEHTESAEMQRNFLGKCSRYKGPKL